MIRDTKNAKWNEKDGVVYLTFPVLEKLSFLRHAFTTRLGGVSQGCFSSMNLSFHRGDSDQNVMENYKKICRTVGFNPEKLVASAQDHHTFIRRVDGGQAGVGITRPRDMESVDGLCTDEPGITLVTYYADCVPLYFADPVHRAIGVAHGGWRGTVQRIAEKMVKKMVLEFGSDPKDLVTVIGPSIGPCCYEVDAPVAGKFLELRDLSPEEFVTEVGQGKFMLDLWECNRRVLLAAGVAEDHIQVSGLCTKCNGELLFSHRVMGVNRGGMAAMMSIREDGICGE